MCGTKPPPSSEDVGEKFFSFFARQQKINKSFHAMSLYNGKFM
jgi:hypothetical protein